MLAVGELEVHLQFNLMSHTFKNQSMDMHAESCTEWHSLNTVKNPSPTAQGTICYARNRACAACKVAINF